MTSSCQEIDFSITTAFLKGREFQRLPDTDHQTFFVLIIMASRLPQYSKDKHYTLDPEGDVVLVFNSKDAMVGNELQVNLIRAGTPNPTAKDIGMNLEDNNQLRKPNARPNL